MTSQTDLHAAVDGWVDEHTVDLLQLKRTPELRGAPFACDVYVFNLHSPTPCVILGLRGENALAPDEWVMIEDLVALINIFALTAADWCGRASERQGLA